MALAVASTSTAVESPYDGTVVVTKPSGVEAGDLLVIVAGGNAETYNPTCSGFTQSFSFGHDSGNSGNPTGFALLYRVADSSDVSASNYTVTGAATAAVTMFRITGWTTGNPIFDYGTRETGTASSSPQTISGSVDVDTPNNQLLIFGMGAGGEGGPVNLSSPAISPNDITWTTLTELDTANGANTWQAAFRVAHGTRSSTSDITSFSFTSDTTDSDETTVIGFIAAIIEPTNATGTPALHTASPTFFGVAGLVGGSAVLSLESFSPTFFDVTGSAATPTAWTTINKT